MSDGQPLKLHRHRIRTTHQSMRDKTTWKGSGRATIDPNHSPQVEGDHYLTATTPAQRDAVDAIIEDAQHDLARRAQPPVVIAEEQAAALARRLPAAGRFFAARRGCDRRARRRPAGRVHRRLRRSAVRTARPEGQALPGPAVGLPAVSAGGVRAAARTEPAAAEGFFARQWRQMPAAQFMAVFGPYSQRIGEILDRYDPAVLAAAARQAGDRDDELPLRPEELTT